MKKEIAKKSLSTYVGFLRGINVGGKVVVKMADLKDLMEGMGYRNVKTILASGNVIFNAQKTSPSILEREIEKALEKKYKREIAIIIRTKEVVDALYESKPFAKIKVKPETRLYVTILADSVSETPKSIKIPYTSPDGEYTIRKVENRVIYSVLTVTEESRTVDAMNILGKEFGKIVTTRNWNTIERIVKAMDT